MKKLLFVFIGLASLLLTSCEGDKYYPEVAPQTWQHKFIVKSWTWDQNALLYYNKIEVPELTDYIFDHGVKQAFMFYRLDNVATQSPLPFSDFYFENNIKWEEYFTVEWQPGWVTFIMKPDDNAPAGLTNQTNEFLVQFLW